MSKISIAICTYNGEKFLSEQLESFAQQSRLPDEVVVCDDCSTDRTLEILQDFAKKSPFEVKIFVNENNLGVTKNFEKAISLCTGDIIFLSDQDDFWLSEKLQIIENEFEKSPETALIFSDAELVDEKLNPLGHTLWEFALWEYSFSTPTQEKVGHKVEFETLLFGRTVAGSNMALRAEVVKFILPFPEMGKFLIHDGWILLVASLFFKITPLNQTLIKYRQHTNQQVGVTIEKNKPENHSRAELFGLYIQDCKSAIERIELLKKTFQSSEIKEKMELSSKLDPMICLNNSYDKFNNALLHYKIRRNMPKSRIKRISKILPEILKGNYSKYSSGLRSVLKDFIEVANKYTSNGHK